MRPSATHGVLIRTEIRPLQYQCRGHSRITSDIASSRDLPALSTSTGHPIPSTQTLGYSCRSIEFGSVRIVGRCGEHGIGMTKCRCRLGQASGNVATAAGATRTIPVTRGGGRACSSSSGWSGRWWRWSRAAIVGAPLAPATAFALALVCIAPISPLDLEIAGGAGAGA